MDQPPLHLVLGRDAVDHMARVMSDLSGADARWAGQDHLPAQAGRHQPPWRRLACGPGN
jgi:hypothetical protein